MVFSEKLKFQAHIDFRGTVPLSARYKKVKLTRRWGGWRNCRSWSWSLSCSNGGGNLLRGGGVRPSCGGVWSSSCGVWLFCGVWLGSGIRLCSGGWFGGSFSLYGRRSHCFLGSTIQRLDPSNIIRVQLHIWNVSTVVGVHDGISFIAVT